MNWVELAIAVVKLAAAIVDYFQRQRWYQEGVNAGIAEQQRADAEARAALQARYDQIAASDLSVDDAAGRLLARGSGHPPVP